MARMKRWESPRRQGRNHKGKGGSARAKQLKKQQNLLRKKLKDRRSRESNFTDFLDFYSGVKPVGISQEIEQGYVEVWLKQG